jgi:hypothetical protein
MPFGRIQGADSQSVMAQIASALAHREQLTISELRSVHGDGSASIFVCDMRGRCTLG